MLLLAETSFVLLKFIQIVSWIIIPVFIASAIITVITHHRKKRNAISADDDATRALLLSCPEQMGFTRGDGEYVLFDHSPLIRQYRKQLLYQNARFRALRNDYEIMQMRVATTPAIEQQPGLLINRTNMHEQPTIATSEVNELRDRLMLLNKSYQQLEEENKMLAEQISLERGTADERDDILQQWKQEKLLLRDRLAEQEYLKDMLEEKKAQLVLLQEQAENRAKAQHLAEHQRQLAIEEKNVLLQQYDQLQAERDQLEVHLLARQQDMEEKELQLNDRQNLVIYHENVLRELRLKTDTLDAELADTRQQAESLQIQLEAERQRSTALEERYKTFRQSMQHVYREFSAFVKEDSTDSPVIALHSVYSTETDHSAAH